MQAAMTHGQWRDISLDILCISVFWKKERKKRRATRALRASGPSENSFWLAFQRRRSAMPTQSEAKQTRTRTNPKGQAIQILVGNFLEQDP